MAEILSPGVFIEEVPSLAQVVQPVSTSNFGIIGGAARGPTDVATLITSFDQYTRVFGGLIRDSYMPLSIAAYFANGGRRAFVVRVAPSDALTARAEIQSQQTDHKTNTGDGVIVAVTNLVLGGSSLRTRAVPSSLAFRWRSANAVPVVLQNTRNRGNTADVQGDGVRLRFEGRINPASIAAFDAVLPAIVPGAVTTLNWTSAAVAKLITLTPSAVGSLLMTGTNGAGSTATLDTRTGRYSVEMAVAELADNLTDIEMSFTPADIRTVSDDGLGVIPAGTALAAPGSVDYLTGAYAFTTTAAALPIANYGIYAVYKTAAWDMNPVSVGTWGDDMRVEVQGNDDFYTLATDSYSKHNVNVLLKNTTSGSFDLVESYEEVSLTDPLSPQYFPDVINDLSDLITIVTPPNLAQAPLQLNGILRTLVLAGGDEQAASRNIVTTSLSSVPVTARTVSIAYIDSTAVARSITDDGAGNLIGDVDPAGLNTIDYVTGAIDVTTLNPINGGTLVTVTWYQSPTEALHREQFGDTAKTYTIAGFVYYRAGTDGTYSNPLTYGRSQFTIVTLEPLFKGLYALNRVEEIMQVAIPDFAGDVQLTTDLLDYVDARALSPAGGDRFAILVVPLGSSAQEAVSYFRFELVRFSKFAALYWPWVKVADPLRDNRPTVFPPLAHIAGIYARTDSTRNVGKAPGGTVDGALKFITGLELVSTQGERDLVYPNKINPLISSPQTGNAVWGVRTIAQESEWRYINARRLFMFIERSIYNSTFWVVFENNGPGLWARIKAQLQGFLNQQFNEGLFAGSTPAQAFFVIVDSSNNDQTSIDAGQVIIDVGIAPNKPAEFVRFRFQQKTLTS